jgi:hypothetical protein
MANAAYWFKHDTNAKDDHKIMLLMDQLGLEGYGIFWILIETLREQTEYRYPLAMLPILAKRYMTSAEKMRAVVVNYELFDIFEDDHFASPALLRRMDAYDEVLEKRRIAGAKGGTKRALNQANAKQMPSKCQANVKQVRSKGVASRDELSRDELNGIEKSKECAISAEYIYQSYPKKVDKGHAIKAINAALKKVDANVLLESVKRYAAQWDGKDKKFCPNPATWFNGERWDDEPELKPNTNGKQYEQRDANGLTRHERTDLQYQITAAVCREREERKRNGVSRPPAGDEGENLFGRTKPHLLGGAPPQEG